MKLILFLLYIFGLWQLFGYFVTSVPASVKEAVKKRNSTGLSDVQVLLTKANKYLEPHIKLPEETKRKTEKNLLILNMDMSAEYFYADVITTAIFYSFMGLALVVFHFMFGILAALGIFVMMFLQQQKQLVKKLRERKTAIERELPQFAGTVRQQLNSTKDIVTILKTYQKICGNTLKEEITRTLNEISTSNTEKALQSFERRIASSKLSEVIRGLIGVYHGEEQTMFFEILTEDLTKAQTEAVVQELLKRPNKLNVNFASTVVVVLAMAFIAIMGSVNGTNVFTF